MLRRGVELVALVVAIVGGCLLLAGVAAPGIQALLLGGITFLALRFERWRDHSPTQPGPDWRSTGERFQDPGSGQTVQVEYNARTGERRYSPVDERPSP